jgi:hypothetical protein
MDGGTVNLGISEIVATSNVTISGGTWASCQLDIHGSGTFSSVLTLNRVNIRIDGGTCTFNSNITCTTFFVHALNGGYTSTCAIGAYTLTVNGYLYVGYSTLCGVITSTTGRLIANSVSYVGGSSGGIGTITPGAGSTLTFNGAVTIYSAGTLGSNTGYTLDINADLTVNTGGTLNLPNSSGAFYMSGSAWYMGGTMNHNNGTTTFDRSGTTYLYRTSSSVAGFIFYDVYVSAGTTLSRRLYGSIFADTFVYNVITVAGSVSGYGANPGGYLYLLAPAPTVPIVLTGSGVWDDWAGYLSNTNQYIVGIDYGYANNRRLWITGGSGGSGFTKTFQGNVQCGDLFLGSYYTLTYTIDMNGYNITAKSLQFCTLSSENITLYIRTGTFRIEGASTISRGTINGNTGIIQLLGAVTLNSPATINASNSPGYIQFGGGFTINSGAVFNKGTGDTIFSEGQNVTDNNAWSVKQDLGNVHITTTGIVNFYGVKMTVLQGDAVGTAYFKANSMITSYIDGVAGFVVDGDAGVTITKS